MADPIRGLAFWPGVKQVLEASFTLSHGITPSVCVMEILPQPGDVVAEYGDLVFTFGDTTLAFLGCKVDRASFQYSESGLLWQLSIFDRRWKWQFGLMYGDYNTHYTGIGDFGSIDAKTKKSPHELAILLLTEMRETVVDVTQLPNETYPETHWEADNPAAELQKLCDTLGCRIAIGLDNITRIVRTGVGLPLPTDNIMRLSAVIDPPEAPDSITVVGGKSEYQPLLMLEAVGLDTDNVIKVINSLSYKPAAGWGSQPMQPGVPWLNVNGWTVQPGVNPNAARAQTLGWINPRQFAEDTVYRWYRVKMTDVDGSGAPPKIPGWSGPPGGQNDGRIKNLWQILPLLDRQVAGWKDQSGAWHNNPPKVFGIYFTYGQNGQVFPGQAGNGQDVNGNTLAGAFCFLDFSVDTETGVVKFSQRAFQQGANGAVSPANLVLQIAVNVREDVAFSFDRSEIKRVLPVAQRNTGTRIVKKEEIVRWVIASYDASGKVTQTTNNDAFVKQESNYYLNAAQLEIQLQSPGDATYMGLIPISPDGAIQQVTWSVGPHGATTRASRQTEWNPAVPSYRERLAMRNLRDINPRFQQLQDQVRKK